VSAVSIAICTRNRGDRLLPALRSALSAGPCHELLVLDQSQDGATQDALRPFSERVRYVRLPGAGGLSAARNHAMREARGELVVFVDDDCEVPPGFVGMMAQGFGEPEVAVVFCVVRPGPHDPSAGVVPVYLREGSRTIATLGAWLRSRGIGAGMAVRRDAVVALGGYDERLFSHEDRDMAMRALVAGLRVHATDRVSVVHHGFRSWAALPEMVERHNRALGACHAKLVRSGRPRLLAFAAREVLHVLARPVLETLLGRRRRRHLRLRLASYARGFAAGWRWPLDRERLVYRA
jgi:GT2 family glycosyltransferase